MDNFFQYGELRKFLLSIADHGVASFERLTESSGIILRHDVDFDVVPAFKMAELEKECEIYSTYFFLTSCPTYNVNSLANRRMLQSMANAGFEIGLHFDPTLYPEVGDEELEQAAIFEASILEFIIGRKVKSISLHNPSVHGQYPIFDSFLNAYAPEYFQPENYLSDSRMNFRDKTPYQFIENAGTQRLQILLHPIHYSEKGGNYVHLMRECVYRFVDDLHENIAVNSQYVSDLDGKVLREIL